MTAGRELLIREHGHFPAAHVIHGLEDEKSSRELVAAATVSAEIQTRPHRRVEGLAFRPLVDPRIQRQAIGCIQVEIPPRVALEADVEGIATRIHAEDAVERLDSDKDTFKNIDELKAGTLPGDPKSKPKK